MPDKKYLSASRIKTLENCSWLYWCNYHLKLPQESNSGAQRGTIVHLVLEVLLKPNRKKYVTKLKKSNTIESIPSIERLVRKHIRKEMLSEEDYEMCDEMILVGLNNEYFGKKGAKNIDPELEFNIENESPRYNIRGFIDKFIEYKDKLEIHDYKSSKEKFKGDELDSNIQAMMYTLVAKKLKPDLNTLVKFIFLRFPKQPIQEVEFDEETLEGFEEYLEYVNGIVDNYNEQDAVSDFAAEKNMPKKGFSGPLLCGFAKEPGQLKKNGDPMWHCPYKFGFEYYEILNDDGEVIGTSKKKPKQNHRKKFYEGCPKHAQPHQSDEFDEAFDSSDPFDI
jgi:hypothetical protein